MYNKFRRERREGLPNDGRNYTEVMPMSLLEAGILVDDPEENYYIDPDSW